MTRDEARSKLHELHQAYAQPDDDEGYTKRYFELMDELSAFIELGSQGAIPMGDRTDLEDESIVVWETKPTPCGVPFAHPRLGTRECAYWTQAVDLALTRSKQGYRKVRVYRLYGRVETSSTFRKAR